MTKRQQQKIALGIDLRAHATTLQLTVTHRFDVQLAELLDRAAEFIDPTPKADTPTGLIRGDE